MLSKSSLPRYVTFLAQSTEPGHVIVDFVYVTEWDLEEAMDCFMYGLLMNRLIDTALCFITRLGVFRTCKETQSVCKITRP